MKLLIVNYKILSYNVDEIVFILFNNSSDFFSSLKDGQFIAFMRNLFLILFRIYWL